MRGLGRLLAQGRLGRSVSSGGEEGRDALLDRRVRACTR
jgi:hypothetical protein